MRKLLLKIRTRFWTSIILFSIMCATFLVMPMANYYSGTIHHAIAVICGSFFWTTGIGAIAMLISEIKWIKKAEKMNPLTFEHCHEKVRFLKIFSNEIVKKIDIAFVISALVLIGSVCLTGRDIYIAYIAFTIMIWSLIMHCMFSGNIYLVTKIRKSRRKK